ncbi:MAG: hypothetical protein ACKPE1_00265 [Dolichospermum sp.]
MTRELLTGNRGQGTGFRRLYFWLLVLGVFRSPTYLLLVDEITDYRL